MITAVIIPWKNTDCLREQARAWVVAQYQQREFPVFIGELRDDEPWCKAVAIARGIRQALNLHTLVIADADVWVEPEALDKAIEAVATGRSAWAQPFSKIFRFNQYASSRVLEGHETPDRMACIPTSIARDERVYSHTAAGGIVVVTLDAWKQVPMDPAFTGYGCEDFSWADALETLIGPRERIAGTLCHFWHTPQPRMSRTVGSSASLVLRNRYMRARGNVGAMQELIDEAKLAFEGRTP